MKKGMDVNAIFKNLIPELVYAERADGDKNIYIEQADYTDEFMGNELTWEFAVDGTHPNDHGMILTAKKLYPIITKLLNK
nr:hypothetical protein [Clostridia bacterium]